MRRLTVANGLHRAHVVPVVALLSQLVSRLGLALAEQTVRVGFLTLLGRGALWTLAGVVAIPLAVFLLWINEGLPDRASLAERAIVLDENPTARPTGLASIQGPLSASEPVGDPLFFEPAPFVQVERVVEMYAWHELVTASEVRRWGGWRERTEQVEYVLSWTPAPPDSSTFRDGSHVNPPLPLESTRTTASTVTVAGQPLLETTTLMLPGARRLLLSEVTLRDRGLTETRTGSMFYLGDADPQAPDAGDVRVRFVVRDSGQLVTWFGAATRAGLTAYAKKNVVLHDLVAGDRAAAIDQLRLEDRLRLVLIRFGGVLLLWVGFVLLGSLTFALLDIAPPVGLAARVVWGLATLPVAGLLGFGTIAVSIVGHDWRATAAVLGAMVLVIIALFYVLPRLSRGDQTRHDGQESPGPR